MKGPIDSRLIDAVESDKLQWRPVKTKRYSVDAGKSGRFRGL